MVPEIYTCKHSRLEIFTKLPSGAVLFHFCTAVVVVLSICMFSKNTRMSRQKTLPNIEGVLAEIKLIGYIWELTNYLLVKLLLTLKQEQNLQQLIWYPRFIINSFIRLLILL